MSTVLDEPITLGAIASAVGVSCPTVNRWAQKWHGDVGKGSRRTYTPADLRVARAWARMLQPDVPPWWPPNCDVLFPLAEQAVRSGGGRWLAVSLDGAELYDTPAEGAHAYLAYAQDGGLQAAWLIDLEPEVGA